MPLSTEATAWMRLLSIVLVNTYGKRFIEARKDKICDLTEEHYDAGLSVEESLSRLHQYFVEDVSQKN